MLSVRAKNKVIDKLNTTFASIGKDMPKSSSNREPYAWEFFVASHLQRLAKGRRDEALTHAIKEGVLFDTDDPANMRSPGTNEAVYAGDHVTVMLSVSKPRVTHNIALIRTYLLDHGVKEAVVEEAIAYGAKEAKAGHQFTAALNTGGDDNGK